MPERGDELHVTEGDLTLPAIDVLTGRGFVTGKSGSGKSNTASVIVEELLEHESRLLIIDTDGEYYGLKEDYEVLHLGATDRCDAVVGPGNAEAVADVALSDGVPVVLDVSGFLEGDDADRLVYEVAKQLFSKSRDVRQPFLLLVEEVHEFVPEQGGLDDVGEMLVRIAKRGRKRGLGLCGLSQRPASVDKDFITQCDWLVWHRLTWANDTRVVDKILGGNYSTDVESLGDGEAFLAADWEQSVRRVQFRRKRTYDAGATPGYGSQDTPDLKPVDDKWLDLFRDGESADSGDSGTSDEPEEEPSSQSSTADSGAESGNGGNGGTGADGEDDAAEGAATSTADGGSAGGETTTTPGPPTPPAGSSGAPATDAKTAVWELGQLVAHVTSVAARRSAVGLARFSVFAARQTDAGLRRLGYRARSMGSRALATVTSDRISSPITTGDDGGIERWSDTPRSPVADRLVGISVVFALALFAYAFVALV
jgi:hypothetical protein